jgi:hypothetical protein
LWLAEAERKKRLETLLNRGEKDSPIGFRVVPLIGQKKHPANWLALDYYVPKGDDPRELAAALVEYVLQIWHHRDLLLREPKTGRASAMAAYRDRLRALSVLRLRRHYGVDETLDLLEKTYRREPFADETTLERAKRRARVYLREFDLKARFRLESGYWFPPFSRHIITV